MYYMTRHRLGLNHGFLRLRVSESCHQTNTPAWESDHTDIKATQQYSNTQPDNACFLPRIFF